MVDSSVCITSLLGGPPLPGDDLVAPALFDSEVLAGLRRSEWAGLVDASDVDQALARLGTIPVARVPAEETHVEALEVARQLGWARTYDAEYVALARLRGAVLVTRDVKLRRGAARLVRTAAPSEV